MSKHRDESNDHGPSSGKGAEGDGWMDFGRTDSYMKNSFSTPIPSPTITVPFLRASNSYTHTHTVILALSRLADHQLG